VTDVARNLRVVIIGAGIVGASLADELTLRGVADVLVVDKGPFPRFGGSTTHAPGMVFQLHQVPVMSQMAQYTVSLLGGLVDADGASLWTETGSLELADDDEWCETLRRRYDHGVEAGLAMQVLTPDQCAQLQPLLDPGAFRMGIYNPTDGVTRSVEVVKRRLAAAESRGAHLLADTEVIGVVREGSRVRAVQTNRGDFEADVVVICGGLWGGPLAALAGEYLPVVPFIAPGAHTPPLATLAGSTADARGPIVRFADSALTWRERGETVEFGYSRHEATPVDPYDLLSNEEAPIMPSMRDFSPRYVDDGWPRMQRLVPDTRGLDYERGQHGLMSTTPDYLPIIGPSSVTDGLWFGQSIWVTHSAGAAAALAEWIVDGESSTFDASAVDARRFQGREPGELRDSAIESIDFFALQRKTI